MPAQYPFKNLVLQGGGVKAFAYRGALEVLEARGVLGPIERVTGASAGALLAMLLSFRLPVADTFAIFNTLDFARVPGLRSSGDALGDTPGLVASYIDWLTGNAEAFARLITRYGWYSTEYARQWIETVVAERCGGNPLGTFADFRQRGFRDLYVVTTNISQRAVQVFSADATPNAPVAYAVLMSQSIPLFFESVRFDGQVWASGDHFADGGVLSNYPLHLFDAPKFQVGNRWFLADINWETLGCRLYTPKDCAPAPRPITNLIEYIQSLLETVLDAQDVAYDNNPIDHYRTINISNCCVGTTDFDVQPQPGNVRYEALVAAGQGAALEFLDHYSPPTRRLWGWVRRNLLGR
jgi:NTE family protein